MIQKKVCMMGYFSVGKTSLLSQYAHSIFSEKYLTTVGVKVDKKVVTIGSQDVTLMLWDIEGEDKFCKLKKHYLRGVSGYILVADISRKNSLDKAIELSDKMVENYGNIPFTLALNKSDLTSQREITDYQVKELLNKGWDVIFTSAKNGKGVESVFNDLAEKMLLSDVG